MRRERRTCCDHQPGAGYPARSSPLSKTYRSEEALEGWYVKPAEWYEEHDIELHAERTVTAIDGAAPSLITRVMV
jgi:NAD(P)H-nitrite reductase large subunit